MYYAVLSAAVIMFSFMFFFNERFEKRCGTGTDATLVFGAIGNLAGLIILLSVNKFRFEFTPFAGLMASLAALNGISYTFCSLKALDKINLSLYSVFAMLGGMLLPFVLGIAVYHEDITIAKVVCFVLIAAALLLTVRRDESGKSGFIYYAGVFLFNGLSGVIPKIYSEADYPKISNASYSVLQAAIVCAACALLLLIRRPKGLNFTPAAGAFCAGHGILGCVGNFLLLIALTYLPASAQYPFVTGGVMIVSTIICFFTPNKPSKREIASVAVSFAGLMALVLIPV